MMGIEDTTEIWNQAVDRINQALVHALEKYGLSDEEFGD